MRLPQLLLGSLVVVALANSASAQTQPHRFQAVNPAAVETITPDAVTALDSSGNPVGPTQACESGSLRSAIFQYAFDSMNNQSNTVPPFGTTPATLQPLWFIGGNYRAYMWANDATAFNTNTAGKHGKAAYLGFYWNPAGTSTPSGSLTFAAKIYTARKFDRTGDGPAIAEKLSGVMVSVNNLSVGASAFKALSFNLSALPWSIPLPGSPSVNDPSSIVVEFGTLDGNGDFLQFNPLVVCAPLFGNMKSPGEPRYPGANVSRSTDLYWADDSNPFTPNQIPSYTFEDFTNTAGSSFPIAELYTGDTEFDPPGFQRGIIQPAITLWIDNNAKAINGTLIFSDQVDASRLGKTATFEVLDSATSAVLSTQTVTLGANQSFSLADPNPYAGGSYRIRYVQNNTWLSKRSAVISTTSGLVTNIGNIVLANGDADQSGEVDAADIDLVIAAFGMSDVDGLGGDLDLSNEVDAADIDIAISNFGASSE